MNLPLGDAGRAVDAAAARALAPVDAVRSALLRVLGGFFRPFAANRDARIVVLTLVATSVALVLAGAAPLWLMAVSPVVLGVPHLASDVRYLVTRPGLHRRAWAALAMGAPLAATWIWPRAWVGLFATLAAVVVARGPRARKVLLLVAWAAAFGLARHFGRTTDVVVAHGHNVVALVLFAALFGAGRRRVVALVAGLFVVGTAVIFAGALDDLFVRAHGWEAPATGLDLDRLVATFSPVADPVAGVRWVLFFAFAQSVHYALWLRVIPEAAREKPGMRPFASSYRALVRELGRPVVLGFGAASLAFIAYALFDLHASREAYLRVAVFHAHLELAALALFAVEGLGVCAVRPC